MQIRLEPVKHQVEFTTLQKELQLGEYQLGTSFLEFELMQFGPHFIIVQSIKRLPLVKCNQVKATLS